LIFKNRPRHLDAVEHAEVKKGLCENSTELVTIGESIKVEHEKHPDVGYVGGFMDYLNTDKRKQAQNERQTLLAFKQAVYILEQDVTDFRACTQDYKDYNPLRPYISLFLGIFSIIISLVWLIHIIVYVLPKYPWDPFLNKYFAWFDKWFSLFGTLSVAMFTIYLLFAAITGCFKFGLRVACMQLHPMVLGKTYMSSFLFNTGLVLLCALPVVQFSAQAFSDYARYTAINQIFNVQIYNLVFFGSWFTNRIFIYIFVVFFFLTCIYLLLRPKDSGVSGLELKKRLELRDRLRARTTTGTMC